MKTKEFIEKVEELGFIAKENPSGSNMVVFNDDLIVVAVGMKGRFLVNTNAKGFRTLDDENKEKVLNTAIEYASTPIEEREEPKKYYLKLPDFVSSDRYCYLNYKERHKHYLFSSDEECEYYQTKFTQEEIDAMPNQEFIKTLMKLEVKE